MRKIILLFCLSLTLLACSTNTPTHFYLLKNVEPSLQKIKEVTFISSEAITILINTIQLPEYLDRPQIVLRKSEYKLQLSEYHRWAEPLKDNFTRVFVKNLNSRITPNNARIYSDLKGIKTNHQLSIEVLQMDVNTKDQVVLRVKWEFLSEKGAVLIKQQTTEYTVPVKNISHESGVEAQSKAIALFADQVAHTVMEYQHE